MDKLTEDYYGILRVSIAADSSEIKRAFRMLAKQHHPDIPGGNRSKFERIMEAYEHLSNERTRKDYDQARKRRLAQEEEEKIRQSVYGIDVPTKIEIILAWATENKTFDTSFIHSCLNQLAQGRNLTIKQENAIENVIARFRIDTMKWLDDEKRDLALNSYFSSLFNENN